MTPRLIDSGPLAVVFVINEYDLLRQGGKIVDRAHDQQRRQLAHDLRGTPCLGCLERETESKIEKRVVYAEAVLTTTVRCKRKRCVAPPPFVTLDEWSEIPNAVSSLKVIHESAPLKDAGHGGELKEPKSKNRPLTEVEGW